MTTIGKVGSPGKRISNPSIAEEIEMGGVIKPSAISAEQPINAATIGHFAGCVLTNE